MTKYRTNAGTYSDFDKSERGREILDVAGALRGLAFIGGGAARYIYNETAPEPSDIDVFLLAAEHEDAAKAKLLELGYAHWGVQGSSNAYTKPKPTGALPVQLVAPTAFNSVQASDEARVQMKRFGTPRVVLDGFTFFCEQFALEAVSGGYRLTWTDKARFDLQARRLRLNRIASPLYATWRIAKYSRKGFKISLYELQRLFSIWDALPAQAREHTLSYWDDDVAAFYSGMQSAE